MPTALLARRLPEQAAKLLEAYVAMEKSAKADEAGLVEAIKRRKEVKHEAGEHARGPPYSP